MDNEEKQAFHNVMRLATNAKIPPDDELFFEEITSGSRDHVITSQFHRATPEELGISRKSHADGVCDRTVFFDVPGYMYDSRFCGICGNHMGGI